jgi:hypothetical protein
VDRSASGEEPAFAATPQSRSNACVPSGLNGTLASLLESSFYRSAAMRLGRLNFGNGLERKPEAVTQPFAKWAELVGGGTRLTLLGRADEVIESR